MSVTTIKTVVADNLAKTHGGDGVVGRSANTFIRKWENVSPGNLEEAILYLRSYTSTKNASPSMSVSSLVVDKTTLTGTWRCGKVSAVREDDGKHTIFQELHEGFVQTFAFSECITEDGRFWKDGTRQIILRMYNVDPAKTSTICSALQSTETHTNPALKYETLSGTFYFIDAVPKIEEDGSNSIAITLWKFDPAAYTVVGGRKSDFVRETQRLYQGIPHSYVTTLVESLVATTGYTLVDCDARKTSITRIFDVTLTLREMLTPPGGEDIVIGGTGGMFKTELHKWRNIIDAEIEGVVYDLLATSLIDDVRATGGKDSGIWDVIYSVTIVPPPRVEYKKAMERNQGGFGYVSNDYIDTYVQIVDSIDSNGEPVYDWVSAVKAVPMSGFNGYAEQSREVSVVKLITYSATTPGNVLTASFSGTTATGGEIIQLSNGLWQKTVETITYPWWLAGT